MQGPETSPLAEVIRWDCGHTVSYDEYGCKVPELTGAWHAVSKLLIRHVGPDTVFRVRILVPYRDKRVTQEEFFARG